MRLVSTLEPLIWYSGFKFCGQIRYIAAAEGPSTGTLHSREPIRALDAAASNASKDATPWMVLLHNVVGLDNLNPVDPCSLKGPRFQPLNLSREKLVSKIACTACTFNLYHYNAAHMEVVGRPGGLSVGLSEEEFLQENGGLGGGGGCVGDVPAAVSAAAAGQWWGGGAIQIDDTQNPSCFICLFSISQTRRCLLPSDSSDSSP
jgi:hypothetical protein